MSSTSLIGARFTRRSTPAFAIGGIGYLPDPVQPMVGYTTEPYGGWACYHCGERFTYWLAAERHFGKPLGEGVAACIGAGELVVRELREARFPHWPEPLALAVKKVDFLRQHRERKRAASQSSDTRSAK